MSTWLVTGANRGIGMEFVRQLKQQGHTVLATARDPEAAAELRALATRVIPLDVVDPASIASLPTRMGHQPIDVLLNNAGVSSLTKTLASCDPADLTRTFAVNAIGPILVTAAMLPQLRAGAGKRIIHITSQLGSITNNTGGSTYAYRGSKAALNQMNRTLALELAPDGFTCIAIHPGWVLTDMGGPHAHLPPEKSVSSMLAVFDKLSPADNGRFLNYDGTPLPW